MNDDSAAVHMCEYRSSYIHYAQEQIMPDRGTGSDDLVITALD